jgi:hypothetical protein
MSEVGKSGKAFERKRERRRNDYPGRLTFFLSADETSKHSRYDDGQSGREGSKALQRRPEFFVLTSPRPSRKTSVDEEVRLLLLAVNGGR